MFLVVNCSIVTQLYGQVFIQAYTNRVSVNPIAGEIFDCSVHILNRQLGTLSIHTDILDSNFNSLGTFESSYFTIQDSLYLKNQAHTFKSERADFSLKEHVKLFVQHSVYDDNGNSLGEFLFEYIVALPKEKEVAEPGKKGGSPVKIKGRVNMTYEYNSSNFPGSIYARHLFIYDISPEISLWNIPLSGNLRISPGSVGQYQQLSFVNFKFDVEAYKRLKEESRNRIEKELRSKEKELGEKAEAELNEQKTRVEQRIKTLEDQLTDSLKRMGERSLPDSLRLPDSSSFDINSPLDTLQIDTAYLDSLRTAIGTLKNELERIKSMRDSLTGMIPDSLGFERDFNPSGMKQALSNSFLNRFSNLELTGLSIGRFYPSLPLLVGNQSSLVGMDVSFKGQRFSHAVSLGKIANFSIGQSSLGMMRYTIGKEEHQKYRMKGTFIYNFSLPSQGHNTIVRNRIIDLEFAKTLVKNEILEFQGEIAGSHLVISNGQPALNNPEQLNAREQSVLINQSMTPGISAMGALAGRAGGFEYSLSYTEISNRFVSVLSPFKINGLRSAELQLKKSLFKNLIQVGLSAKIMEEPGVSGINQYKANLRLNPKRLPKMMISYMHFNRNYVIGSVQQLDMLNIQSLYSMRILGALNRFQLAGNFQRNTNFPYSTVVNQLFSFSDQILVSKAFNVGINLSANRMAITSREVTTRMEQNSASINLVYLFREFMTGGLSFRILESGKILSTGAGASLGVKIKQFQLSMAYDLNATFLSGDLYTTKRTINRFQSTIGYAF